jgi:hypothetical protein
LIKAGIFSVTLLALTLNNAAQASNTDATIAPYLREDAPVFNLTIAQFREKFNAANPQMALTEYKAVKTLEAKSPLIRAVSRINNSLYSSVAIDKSQHTIKSLQLTYLPPLISAEKPESAAKTEKANQALLVNYMAAFINQFEPTLTPEKCQSQANELLVKGKGLPFYQQTDGTLRLVVSDQHEKGITFAVEPIKLSLAEQ